MKDRRVFCFCLFTFFVFTVCTATRSNAGIKGEFHSFCRVFKGNNAPEFVKTPTDGGIREIVGKKHLVKYERWKNELLRSDFGREQWDQYAANKNFILTIKIDDKSGYGAGTADYQWNEEGKLVGATIILGSKIDKGYPNPVYYPVMNSLSMVYPFERNRENVLAAAKIAHEFGHIVETAKTDGNLFRRQNSLMLEYNEILLAKKFNSKAVQLVSLREKLGGTPVEIWESREYWGETNSMFYLLDRIEKESFFCSVVGKIEDNVEIFALNYRDRFLPVFKSNKTCRQ